MSKLLAAMIASLFAVGASAQNPPGTTSQEQVITNSKPQQRAQAKDDAKPHGMVKKPTGDEAMSAQSDAVATGKSAAAGQSRVEARDERHPNRKPSKQGGTPDMPGAK
ncbi:cell envelope biogenesis protein TolA [Variovorax robiniae]|uniref:Cell envelope biogenesis protein TolA n=1 Tax=Variovorax robiniae TaxID=1836199 RepID=A0ABU8XHT5_9BURK